MALTKVGSVGIATGISLTGVTTTQDAKVGTGITLSPDGDGYYTGIVTATSYRGDVSNCTGVGQTNFIDAESLNVSGISTLTGQATVGTGITLSPDGDVFATGVCTATSFVGDGSGLTNAGPSLTGSTNNTVVTVTGSNAIQGEANLTYDGSSLGITRGDSGTLDGVIMTNSDSVNNGFSLGVSSVEDAFLWNGNNTNMTFATNNAEKMRVDSSGRLLIGTTDTDSVSDGEVPKLIIKATDSTAAAAFVRYSANSGGTGIFFGKSRNAAVGSNTIVQSGDELGRITFSGDDGTNINTMGSKIASYVDGTPGENDMPGRLAFYTTADGASTPTERLRINSDGQISIKGTTTAFDTTGDLDSLQLYYETDSGQASIGPYSSGGSTHLSFYTNASAGAATEKLRITSAGDVLIGRTSTSTGHTVCIQADSNAEAVSIVGRSADDISEIGFFENDTTTRLGEIQYRQDYVNFRHRVGSLRWCAAGTVEHMRLDTVTVNSVTTGVLGINDDSPGGESLALTVKNKNFQETALPVVHIERVNSAGGGSGLEEIALNCKINTTYNNGGASYAIKSYGCHNLNSTHYAGYFEARGSQYAAGGDGAGIYAQITKTDTNGGGYVPAAFFYGKHTYNASDTGYAMGIRVKVQALTKNTGIMIHHEQTNSDWTPMIRFCKGSSETEVGTIKSSNTATQYNTSSDYRLKENVVDLTGAITRLKQLKPKRFNFKNDTSNTVDGFIAHEVEPVVPQAVSGTKDATKIETVQDPSTGKTIMLEDGTPKLKTVIDPQEVDYSKLSTLTIAALQEALAKIETLETKVAALESA